MVAMRWLHCLHPHCLKGSCRAHGNPPHGMSVPVPGGRGGQRTAGSWSSSVTGGIDKEEVPCFSAPPLGTQRSSASCQRALVLVIHFPKRGTAQCHPLLTYTSCETETKGRQGLATQLGYHTGPIPAASGSQKQVGACGIRP